MSVASKRLDSDQWTRYWQKGTLTTFLGSFQNNYTGPIKDFWCDFFGEIPSDSKIVDLATGNGALAVLASEYCQEKDKNFEITGIDFAEIDPSRIAHQNISSSVLSKIRFIGKTSIEESGLEANYYDAAISQFGFEYSDVTKSAEELSRILKPRAGVALFMHCENSDIVKQAKDGIEQNEFCLKSELHNLIIELLKSHGVVQKNNGGKSFDENSERLRHKINMETEKLHDISDKYTDKTQLSFFLKNSMAVFGNKLGGLSLEQKVAALNYVKDECFAFDRRMNDLISAARKPEEILDIESALNYHRFKITRSEEFNYNGSRFGYILTAER